MRNYLKMMTPAALAAFLAACATGGRQEQPAIVPRDTPVLEKVVADTAVQIAPEPVEAPQQLEQAAVQVTSAQRPVRPVPEGVVSDSVQYSFDWDRRTPMWRLSENFYFQGGGIRQILERVAQYNNIPLDSINNRLSRGTTINLPIYNGREVEPVPSTARNGDNLRSLVYRAIAQYTNTISHASGFTDDGISVMPIEEARRRRFRVIREIPPGDYYADTRGVVEDNDGIHGDNPARGRAPNERIRIVVPGYYEPDPSRPAPATGAPPPRTTPAPVAPAPDSTTLPQLDSIFRNRPRPPVTTSFYDNNGANSTLVTKIAEYNGLRPDSMLSSGDYVRFAIGGREITYQVPLNNENGRVTIRLQDFMDGVIKPGLNQNNYLALTTLEHARKQNLTIVCSAIPGKTYEKDCDLVTVVLGDVEPQTASASTTRIASNPSTTTTPNTRVASLEKTLILDPIKAAEAWVASKYGNGVAEQPLSDRVYIPSQITSTRNGRRQYQPKAA